jgi:hypothetical protein
MQIVADICFYVRSFWRDWVSRMTGIASLALLVWSVFWNAQITRMEVFGAAVVCYVVASFRVWQLEAKTVDRIYADIVLDWLKRKKPQLVTSTLLAHHLQEPEKNIKRGLVVLERWKVVRNDGERGWTYVPSMAGIDPQFRRLTDDSTSSS